MTHFDLVVIGAGPAGFAAAMRAHDFKKKTLLIERDRLGGAGMNNGALSSKTWWELSRDVAALRKQLKKYNIQAPAIDFEEVYREVQKAIAERKDLLEEQMRCFINTADDYFEYRIGEAKLLDQYTVEIATPGHKEIVHADYIILATGSKPRYLPELPIDEKIIMTSDGIEHMSTFPESLVIVGAGVIGCEYATIFSSFGHTKVYLIDKGARILPFEDEDVVDIIQQNMENNGVVIHHQSKLADMKIVDGHVEYTIQYDDGTSEMLSVEKALVSVGRTPNLDNLIPSELGLMMHKRGVENLSTQTNIPNIYAVGDLTSDISLVNIGELEGRHAVEKIFGRPSRQLVYDNISNIMFLNPEVASVGINELQAQAAGLDYRVATLDYATIPRAIAKRNTQGFIKLITRDDQQMQILGMKVVGNHASSAIQAVALLISMGKGIEELAECVHPHPSIIEGVQECVRMLMGKSLLKPMALSNSLTCKKWINGKYINMQDISE